MAHSCKSHARPASAKSSGGAGVRFDTLRCRSMPGAVIRPRREGRRSGRVRPRPATLSTPRLSEVDVRGVGGAEALLHAHQLLLARGELVEQLRGEAIVRVELEEEHELAVMTEERVAVCGGSVLAAAVPALAVED